MPAILCHIHQIATASPQNPEGILQQQAFAKLLPLRRHQEHAAITNIVTT
jgi:hypothetical protein